MNIVTDSKFASIKSRIISTGSYLPSKIITNDDLAKTIDTSDEWIKTRTGISQRHIAEKDEFTSHMAAKAALDALKKAKVSSAEIDLIIVATTTPDSTFPSVATKVQAIINAKNAAAFDVQAVCSGFIYAVSIANNFIKTGQSNKVLVIGAEKMSSILNWQDRTTCVLFGDGAGAILIEKAPQNSNSFIASTHLFSDGSYQDILYADGGVASNQLTGHIKMDGKEVFKHAIAKMSDSLNVALTANNLTKEDITWLVPHQANARILEMLAKKFNFDENKVINCVANHANTSAASIPLALDYANNKNIFRNGDIIAVTAIGGGLTWGSGIIRW